VTVIYAAVSAAWGKISFACLERKGKSTDKIVEFDGGYALVDTGDDFLSDGGCINMLGIEAITKP
jgi:hypothetical protein